MHPGQINQIRDCFVHVLFDPERASRLFYGELFALAPETRALFTRDMDAQGRILIQSLATIVTGLERFDAMAPGLCALAIRHVGYGVEQRHYAIVGVALIDMLTTVCNGGFDPATRGAWTEAYALVADTMMAAAYDDVPT